MAQFVTDHRTKYRTDCLAISNYTLNNFNMIRTRISVFKRICHKLRNWQMQSVGKFKLYGALYEIITVCVQRA